LRLGSREKKTPEKMVSLPSGSASPLKSGGGARGSNLDGVSKARFVCGSKQLIKQLSLDKLKSRLIMNQEKRMALMDKREEMRNKPDDDDEEEEDPDMMEGQM
jgi:hypothetical protein